MRVNKASLHIHVSCQTCPVFQQLLKGSCLVKLCFYRSVASFQSINEGLAGSHLILPSFQSINEGLAGSHLLLVTKQKTVTYLQSLKKTPQRRQRVRYSSYNAIFFAVLGSSETSSQPSNNTSAFFQLGNMLVIPMRTLQFVHAVSLLILYLHIPSIVLCLCVSGGGATKHNLLTVNYIEWS